MIAFYSLLAGFFLDCLIGDPHHLYHPVQFIGWLIHQTEKRLRSRLPETKQGQLLGGFLLAAVIIISCAVIPGGILYLAAALHPLLFFLLHTIMCWQILALKSLRDESMKVADAIVKKDVEHARFCLSMIVGRDTKNLSPAGIIRAAVETVAENTSDGVIAPLFFLILGGPVAGFVYKGINTMDSMIGYQNEKYLYFGRAAARLDDIANFIPARLSALLLIFSAFLLGYDYRGAWQIFRRDRKNHQSPNSAQTEAACAGALKIRLAGDAWYGGRLHKKPFIGDDSTSVHAGHILMANRLLYTSAFSLMAIYILLYLTIHFF